MRLLLLPKILKFPSFNHVQYRICDKKEMKIELGVDKLNGAMFFNILNFWKYPLVYLYFKTILLRISYFIETLYRL